MTNSRKEINRRGRYIAGFWTVMTFTLRHLGTELLKVGIREEWQAQAWRWGRAP